MDDLIFYGIGVMGFLAVCSVLYACIAEAQEWEEFKNHHHCKVVSRIKGDVFNTVGADAKGNMVVGVGSTPDKTGWLCDDGITYYR